MMLAIPSEDQIAALQDNNVLRAVFAGAQEPPSLKILGIAWNYVKDEMYFNFTTLIAPIAATYSTFLVQSYGRSNSVHHHGKTGPANVLQTRINLESKAPR
jgi:hypothetical protein